MSWRRIEAPDPQAFAAPPSPETRLLFEAGVPVFEGVTTARDYAIELLKVAAEIEHALMVQYLYAADSLESVDDIHRQKLRAVAIEEMGHLATVQNILLLVGGTSAFHLQRDLLRLGGENSPIPFALEGISLGSLARFILSEMPADVAPHLEPTIARLRIAAVANGSWSPRRVGAIYAALTLLFDKVDSKEINLAEAVGLNRGRLSDDDLNPAAVVDRYGATRAEWGPDSDAFILSAPANREEARAALRAITEQGEGGASAAHSHFEALLQLLAEFEQGACSAREVAISPALGLAPGGVGGSPITHAYTRAWAEVQSLQYTLMLLSILHAVSLDRSEPKAAAHRPKLVQLALRAMGRIVDPLAAILFSLPMESGGAEKSGPTYELAHAQLEPGASADYVGRNRTMLQRLRELYAAIEAAPEFQGYPRHKITIANLRQFDLGRSKVCSEIEADGL